MTKKTMLCAALAGVLLGAAGLTFAQFGGSGLGGGIGGRGGRGALGGGGIYGGGRGAGRRILSQDLATDRNGTPMWQVDPHFKHDLYTFVRIRYTSDNTPFPDGTYKSGGSWATDFPDSDLHFPFRVQEMTSIKTDPVSIQLDLTDDAIFDYPMLYMLEVGRLQFTEQELPILRRYLLNGGFLLVDDHWGLNEQRNWREQLARVFPDRTPVELDISHPIFHCVFDLKELPQIPGIENWQRSGLSYERADDPKPHYRATYDEKGRMMILEAANTDLGDGWERETVSAEYFHKFSEKQAYPMGINIIFWAMTH